MFYRKMNLACIAIVMCCLYSCRVNPAAEKTSLQMQDSASTGTFDRVLTIKGKGFSNVATDNKVIVDDVEASIISASDNQLVVHIPARRSAKMAVSVRVGNEISDTVLVDSQIVMLAGR